MNNISNFLPLVNIFGFIVLGAAMIFTQWRLGGNRVSVDVIQTYKERVDQLITENGTLRTSQVEQGKQIVALQTESKSKDQKISELMLLITGKDPAQVEYMQQMKTLADQASAFIVRSDDREDKIFKALEKLKK